MKVWVLMELEYYDSEPRPQAVTSREDVANAWEGGQRARRTERTTEEFELDDLRQVGWQLKKLGIGGDF